MSRHTARARSGHDRTSLYDEITTKIIAELEAGRVPWVQPWGTAAAKAPLAMPKNAATGRSYSGINVLILWGVGDRARVSGPRLAHLPPGAVARRQCPQGRARHHRRLCRPLRARRREEACAARPARKPQAIPFLKRFTVFNLAQCEGLPEDLAVAAPPPEPGLIEPKVEALIQATRRRLPHRRQPRLLRTGA